MSNTGQAWVTLATNDSYALGALVLAQSLKRNNTIHQLAVLITPGVSPSMREALSSVFDVVREVDVLDSQDAANLALLERPDLGVTFTKLHCWNLTQYTKCVFLDADTLVVKNSDELFERDELSAAPDAGWPDCFNSGVFVFTPSEATFKSLLEFALTNGSFDGGDQGLLNMYFGDWATKDITKHLPFIYNMVATATYSYLPAFKAFGGNVKIAHFIGSSKPWLQALPSGSTLSNFLDLWWDIFLKDVSKKLDTNMIINSTVFEEGPASKLSTPHPPPPSVQRHVFVDPWDYVLHKQPEQTDSTNLNSEDVIDILVEHLKQTQHHHQGESHNSSEQVQYHVSTPHNQQTYVKQISAPDLSHNRENFIKEAIQIHSNVLNQQKKTQSLQHLQQKPLRNKLGQLYTQKEDIREEPLRRVESYENIPSTISPPITPSCVEQTSFLTKSEEPTAVTEEGGLAGALAGGQRDVIEDQFRKQSWEQGNIDYMGKDAFENIWKKMSETVDDIKPLETPAPETPAPETPAPETPAPETPSTPEESAPAPETPKTEDKTDSSEVETQQISAPPVETPQLKVEEPQQEAPKVEPVSETATVDEAVEPPKPDAPQQPTDAPKAEEKPKEVSKPAALPAEAAPAQPAPEVKPESESAPSAAGEATLQDQAVSISIPPLSVATEAPAPAAVEPLPAAATESDVSAPFVVPQPPTPTVEPPTPPLPEPAKDPSTPPPAEKKGASPPKDAAPEKVAAPLQEPVAPASPSTPSPASPSAPEGTKIDSTQAPPPPDPQTPTAETSSPPQTPVGDAPVPPKRSSKKGKAKK